MLQDSQTREGRSTAAPFLYCPVITSGAKNQLLVLLFLVADPWSHSPLPHPTGRGGGGTL
jgi:hypothetical protein